MQWLYKFHFGKIQKKNDERWPRYENDFYVVFYPPDYNITEPIQAEWSLIYYDSLKYY